MNELEQFKDVYITECYELLADMEERLLPLEEGSKDLEELNAIFRCVHSIKGGAGAFGFNHITRFTHGLEALLDKMREGEISPTRAVIDILLESVDIMRSLVNAAKTGDTLPDTYGKEIEALIAAMALPKELGTSILGSQPAADEITFYAISFTAHKNLFSSGNEPLLIIRELGSLGKLTTCIDISTIPTLEALQPEECISSWRFTLETAKSLPAVREVFEFVEDVCDLTIEAIGAVSEKLPEVTPLGTPSEHNKAPLSNVISSIRVDVDKVDRLVNMVGELVITQAMLVAQTRHLPAERFQGLLDGITQLSHHTRELQEAVMLVRMQAIKTVFSRMPRIVHDLCNQLGKKIHLDMVGEGTEVDKTLIEQLSDPLIHMIRNAVDHGIESPEQRKSQGKPEEGTITLSAEHRGGRIIIEISDDGAGINREKVLASAKEKGIISSNAILTEEEIDHLLFLPGFSTAEEVTNISGRGVGMDVVKKNISTLGGTVEIASEKGKGTSFTVSLPLTLAILEGMIIRVGEEHYIIPITNIIETMRPRSSDIQHLVDGNDTINIRGEFVPVLYLAKQFHIQQAESDPAKALVVLVEARKEKFGLVVDELIGQQQVVIKSLIRNASAVPGISGATILGDGKVSLILDIGELHHKLNHTEKYPLVMDIYA